jgi:hypothetical protein
VYSDNPKLAKKILTKLMQSLKFGKKFGIPEMGEILLLDDIPLPQHDPDDPSITSAKSEVPLTKASQAILSLFCQCNFK